MAKKRKSKEIVILKDRVVRKKATCEEVFIDIVNYLLMQGVEKQMIAKMFEIDPAILSRMLAYFDGRTDVLKRRIDLAFVSKGVEALKGRIRVTVDIPNMKAGGTYYRVKI